MLESRKRDIRKQAYAFREKCKVSRYGIIDLFKECERSGYKLLRYPLGSEADLGFVIRKDNDIVIFTNTSSRLAREIFTLAHEIGHIVLHFEKENTFIDDAITITGKNADEKEQEANYFASCLLMPFNLLSPVFWSFMERINRRGVLYVDTQQCNFLDYKQCIRTLQLYFLASESAIRYRLVNIGWMRFNMHFEPTIDRGISIAEYLKSLGNQQ